MLQAAFKSLDHHKLLTNLVYNVHHLAFLVKW